MPKQNKPAPKQGSFRRDRGSRSGSSGVSKSGKITKKLWDKVTGWDNPGR